MATGQDYLGEILVRRGVVPWERLAPLFETVDGRPAALEYQRVLQWEDL